MRFTNCKSLFIVVIIGLLCYACDSIKEEKKVEQKIVKVKKEEAKEKQPNSEIEKVEPRPTVNVKPYEVITSPKTIRVNSQGVWTAGEGELGWVQLIDNDGQQLAKGILSAEGEWMVSGPAMFSTELSFDAKGKKEGKLVIHNNPGEGEGAEAGEKISFDIPVRFEAE